MFVFNLFIIEASFTNQVVFSLCSVEGFSFIDPLPSLSLSSSNSDQGSFCWGFLFGLWANGTLMDTAAGSRRKKTFEASDRNNVTETYSPRKERLWHQPNFNYRKDILC